jgi:hypothetical protein
MRRQQKGTDYQIRALHYHYYISRMRAHTIKKIFLSKFNPHSFFEYLE